MTSRLIVEADGGSRGNPGPAGYGAVVIDAATGEVLAERGEFIGVESNNVAEYRGLIAGLQAARELHADAVAVRMDSKLVVQQMSGAWQIKHPTMRVLAGEAAALVAGFGDVTFDWIPRAQNTRADRIANEAMDLGPGGVVRRDRGAGEPASASEPAVPAPDATPSAGMRRTSRAAATGAAATRGSAETTPAPVAHWTPPAGATTRLILVRHGSTEHSPAMRLSGINQLPLSERGQAQADALAARLAGMPSVGAVLSSPLLRARQTAAPIAQALGLAVQIDEGLQEVDFGAWEGLTFAEAARSAPEEMAAWSRNPRVAPPGGESFEQLAARVLPARDKIIADYAGRTVIAVSHVSPIKLLLADGFGAPLESIYRVFLDTASISIVDYPEGRMSSVRLINETAHLPADIQIT